MPDEPTNLLTELKFSAGTPIEAILEAVGKIIKPFTEIETGKRETMSQENRDRNDLLEYSVRESICLRLGLVTQEQLKRLRLQGPPQ